MALTAACQLKLPDEVKLVIRSYVRRRHPVAQLYMDVVDDELYNIYLDICADRCSCCNYFTGGVTSMTTERFGNESRIRNFSRCNLGDDCPMKRHNVYWMIRGQLVPSQWYFDLLRSRDAFR